MISALKTQGPICVSADRRRSSDRPRAIHVSFSTMTAIAALMARMHPAVANPTGGTVVGGSASISSAGSVTNVNQSTTRAVIDWLSFSVGAGETVNFYQPTSITLNRVVGNTTAAGKKAIAAIEAPKIEDNVEVEEAAGPTAPATEQPRARRSKTTSRSRRRRRQLLRRPSSSARVVMQARRLHGRSALEAVALASAPSFAASTSMVSAMS